MLAADPRYRVPKTLAAFCGALALLAAIQLTFHPASAQSTIAFVQVNSAVPQAPSTTVAVTYAAAQTAGNLNVIVVGWNDTTAVVQSVVDSRGNVYTLAVGPTVRAGSATQSIYYSANIAAAPANGNTVTVTFAPAAIFADIRIAEYRGIATTSPVDVVAGASGSSATANSGAVTTTNANDLLVGANTVQTITSGAGSSFTQRIITSPDADILEDRIVTAVGSYSATAPMASGWWVMQMVAFKAAGSPTDTQSPTAPGTPVLTVVSSTRIDLTWPVATDNIAVTGYRVERCAGANCTTFAQVGTPTTASFSNTGLAPATSYSYRVRATDAAGNLGPYSATATAATPADTQAPTAPGTPVPTVVSSSQINLTWPVATDNVAVTGYLVERCAGTGCTTFAQVGTPTTASFNDTGLTGSTPYNYRVRATDAATNLGPYSAVASATTQAAPDTQAPTAPGTPVLTVVSSNRIDLTWPAATDNVAVTGYRLERCTGAGCSTFAQVAAPATTSFSDTGLGGSTSYSYRVRATDAANNLGAYSPTATATTQGDTQPPTAPGMPVPTVVSSTQINLTWPAATDDVAVTGYRVERCAGAGCSTFGEVAAPATASFSDTGLVASTSYSYRVRATDAASNLGPYSATATATTQAGADTQPPTAPGTPVPTVVSTSQINLTWPVATDNIAVTGYRVERCAGTGCSTFSQVAAPATASFNDTGLAPSTSYSYRVRATDAASNLGPYSATATATTQADTQPPTAPGTPVPTVVSTSQINLTWPAATDDVAVTGYRVERCAGAGCSTTFAQVGTPATASFSDTGLSASTSYSYRVRATDAAGNLGAYSANATATTLGTNPSLVAAYAFNEGSGTTVADLSGRGNTGTIANATWATGKYDSALAFNGSNALVTIADSASLHLTTAMTLEAWVNPSVVSSAWRDVLYKGNDNYYLEGTTTVGGGVPTGAATISGANNGANGTSALTPNTWSHLAVTFDGATLRLYVNGTQVGTLAQAGTIVTSTNPLQIGGDSIYGQFFQGMIDEVRVYNTALTLAQIQADMNAPVAGSVVDSQPPTAPGTLVATAISQGQINLTWTAATDNFAVTGYRIERCQGAGCSNFVEITAAGTATTFSDATNLTTGTSYSYRVRATDAAGNLGPYSNTSSATTLAPDTTPPSAPGRLDGDCHQRRRDRYLVGRRHRQRRHRRLSRRPMPGSRMHDVQQARNARDRHHLRRHVAQSEHELQLHGRGAGRGRKPRALHQRRKPRRRSRRTRISSRRTRSTKGQERQPWTSRAVEIPAPFRAPPGRPVASTAMRFRSTDPTRW